jgi:hypothetical protein
MTTHRRPLGDTHQIPGDTYWFFSPDAVGMYGAYADTPSTHPRSGREKSTGGVSDVCAGPRSTHRGPV